MFTIDGLGAFSRLIDTHFAAVRKSRRKTIFSLALGLLTRARVGLAEIARGMTDDTTVRHRIKRVWRFLRNPGVRLEEATVGLVHWIFSNSKTTAVVALDWTDWGDYMLLAAKVAVDGRAVPIAWMVMRKHLFDRDRKSRNDMEENLIFRLREALWGHPWVLVADRGFARADLFRLLRLWQVSFVIRATCKVWVRVHGFSGMLESIPRRPNVVHHYAKALYHKTRGIPVGLVVTHQDPAPEPWYLVTSPDQVQNAVSIYRKRMWIEEGFRDAKSNLGLMRFWAARPERMERMMILVALVMLIAILTALDYRRRFGGRDPQLTTKRKGRCLSLFRLGLELIRLHGIPPNLGRTQLLARMVTRPLLQKEA